MMVSELADISHWEKYWEGFVPEKFESHKIDPIMAKLPNGLTSLEIGGFPGQISAYLRNKKNFDTCILDRYIKPELVTKTEQAFDVEAGSIKYIKADFFDHDVQERYDIVHSHGFIEHFEETGDILTRHLHLTNEGGYVLVTMPNLRNSFYGWLSKRYAYDYYVTHCLKVMDPEYLNRCCRELDIQDFEITFVGSPGQFWLPDDRITRSKMLFFEWIGRTLGVVFRNVKSQRLSPGIAILMNK